jgi:glycosyltransferase involved in cell wall biosynthesis
MRLAAYTDAVELGGAEKALANLLAELDPSIEITLLGVEPPVLDALLAHRPGASAVLLPPIAGKSDVRAIAAHVRAVVGAGADVLHVNRQSPWAGRYAILAALAARLPVVAVEHLPMAIHKRWQRTLTRWASSRMAAHVAVGERAARLVEHNAGLPPGSAHAVHNGVALLAPEPSVRTIEGPVVGSVGRLDEQKGYDVLVDALPHLPGVTAVLVGEGPARHALERRADALGVGDRLVLLGWRSEPLRELPTFDIFALPSRYEGFPLAIVEAMLAGLPVVATAVGSISEAVVDGVTGRLVAPEDRGALASALQELLDDAELRMRMGERGRERARARFTAAAMARSYERIYAESAR